VSRINFLRETYERWALVGPFGFMQKPVEADNALSQLVVLESVDAIAQSSFDYNAASYAVHLQQWC
jgi:hypothetical protein